MPDRHPLKPLQTILDQEMHEAEFELARPARGLFLSGLLAGIGVGFSVVLITILMTELTDNTPEWFLQILVANAYTVGFIIVILARSDLYTEYTTIAIIPVLAGHATVGRLARLWGLVLAGNLIGAAAIAAVAVVTGPALGRIEPWAFAQLADDVVQHAWWVLLLSSMLAGWLMGLLSWLVTSGRETISQIALIWMVTGIIGYAHLHHAVAGSAEVLAGVYVAALPLQDFGFFLFWTTLGNAIGGLVFAWLVYNSALLAATRESRGKDGSRRKRKSGSKPDADAPR